MNRRDLVMTAQAIDKLRAKNAELWGKLALNLLRIMHELRSKDYYMILDIFDRPLIPGQEEEDIVLALPAPD